MKVLVTGGAGFIGGHISEKLIKKGHDVRIFDQKEPAIKNAEFIKGDITDKYQLEAALDGVDVISHQAALGGFSANLSDYVKANLLGISNILDIIREKKLKINHIVYASSSAVYGEGSYLCESHGLINSATRDLSRLKNKDWELICPFCSAQLKPVPIKESKPADADHIYALTKFCGERMLINVCKDLGIKLTIFRYSLVYGPGEASFRICSIFSNKLLKREAIKLYEDGNQLRDLINVEDVADANLFAIEKGIEGTFNLGTGIPISLLQLVELLSKLYNMPSNIEISGEFRYGDTRHNFLDNSLLKEKGFTPAIPLEEGLIVYKNWLEDKIKTASK